jgi:hypothetical protein
MKFEWLGHIVRMDGVGRVKKLLEGKPGGRSKKEDVDEGGWVDDVELDWRNMRVERWRTRFGQNTMGVCCEGS